MPATLLRDFWYVVARSRDVDRRPLARKLIGRELVVFRDDRGDARVLDAVCPHRGANLARGQIVNGQIACPYHGWQFDGSGRCTRIPANDEATRVPAGHATTAFPVIEQQGLIWTSIGTPVAPPPYFSTFDDPAFATFCYEIAGPVPFDWWMENALDFAHLPFIHANTIGDDNALIDEFEITRRDDHLGFTARVPQQRDYSFLARALRLDMNVSVELTMPGTAMFDIDLGRGRRQQVLAIATPEDERSIRTWNFSLRNFLRVPFGNAVGWLFLRAVVQEDFRSGLQSLAPISLDRDRMLSSRADELSLEFLRLARWWRAREANSTLASAHASPVPFRS